ncbi:MAG: class IV adenylate cyclase [Melioribacteraceae bacterium]|nr:class IV adenylate cyclase [Melioribacteraceae bacterium]
MALNLELKIKVKSFDEFEKILNDINANYVGIINQKDIYYKFKNGLLKLRVENNSYTLIKYLRNEKNKRWSNYELLELKGKNPEKYLKEILQEEIIVKKKRKLYLFNNTRIHLDEVSSLGKFLELETLLIGDKNDATKRFIEIKNILGLNDYQEIRKSYKNLLEEK